jgi:hypothetical protein
MEADRGTRRKSDVSEACQTGAVISQYWRKMAAPVSFQADVFLDLLQVWGQFRAFLFLLV